MEERPNFSRDEWRLKKTYLWSDCCSLFFLLQVLVLTFFCLRRRPWDPKGEAADIIPKEKDETSTRGNRRYRRWRRSLLQRQKGNKSPKKRKSLLTKENRFHHFHSTSKQRVKQKNETKTKTPTKKHHTKTVATVQKELRVSLSVASNSDAIARCKDGQTRTFAGQTQFTFQKSTKCLIEIDGAKGFARMKKIRSNTLSCFWLLVFCANKSEDMSLAVGIDLGTSNSVMSYFDGQNVQTIADAEGRTIHPSVVAYGYGNTTVVGYRAKQQISYAPENTISSAKRLIGQHFDSPEIQRIRKLTSWGIVKGAHNDARIRVQGQVYTPQEVSAHVLRHLKKVGGRV